MVNRDVRDRIRIADVRYWQVARELNMKASNFSAMLRDELSDEKKQQIFEIIDRLSMKQEETA